MLQRVIFRCKRRPGVSGHTEEQGDAEGRDPANIGLTKDEQIEILHFGLARINDGADSSPSHPDAPAATSYYRPLQLPNNSNHAAIESVRQLATSTTCVGSA